MPATVSHVLTATTPDNPAYEIRPSHWNSNHVATISAVGSEIFGAFSNDPAYNVSFTTNGGGFVVASANVTAAPSPVNVTGNGSSVNAQTIAFTNSNGITLGVSTAANGATITGSHNAITTGALSNHSHGDPQLNLTNLSGTTASNSAGFTLSLSALAALTSQSNQNVTAANGGFAFQTLSFSNLNGISFGTSAGSAITASHNAITTARASTDAIGLNTAQSNVTWTVNSSGISFDARGYGGTATAITGAASITHNSAGLSFNGAALAGTTSGFTGANISATITHNTLGLAISASVAAPGAATLTVSAVGNTTVNSSGTWPGAISLRAYGILSAGTSNGSLLLSTPDPVDYTYLSVGNSNLGNTAGDTGVFSQRMVLVGSNNITLSGSSNGGSVTLSIIGGAGGGFSAGVSNIGNTAGNTGLTGTNIVFSGGNGVSLSQSTHANGGTIGFSVNTSYAASNHSHGNPTLNLTNLSGTTASASNGLTLSLSAAAPQTAISGIVASDTTYTSGTVSFSAQNGITIGSSVNGATQYIRLSVPTIPAQFSGGNSNLGNTAGDTGVFTGRLVLVGSNNITLSGSSNGGSATLSIIGGAGAAAATGISGIIVSDATYTSGTVSFSNQNGVTIGSSVNGASQYIRLSVATSYRASNDGLGTATAQTNVTWTANSAGVSLNAGGYAGTVSGFTGANISGTFTMNTVGYSASLSVAAQTNQTAGLYATGNTTQNSSTTFDARTLGTFNGLGAMTVGFSNGSVQFSAPATSSIVGVDGISISTAGSTISVRPVLVSAYENNPAGVNQTMTFNGASVSHAVYFELREPISASYIRIPALMTTNSTTIATTAATRSVSGAIYSTWNAVIYSLGVGANSRSLQSVASGSNGWTFMNSLSIAVNGTQYSVTQAFSANAEGAGTTRTTQYSISNTNYSLTTNQIATEWSSGRFIDIAFANSLSAGPYWLIFGMSSSSATNSAGAWTDANVRYSNHFGFSRTDMAFGVMGSTNLSSGAMLGAGSFSTAGGGTTASLPLSAISSSASHVKPYFQLIRQV